MTPVEIEAVIRQGYEGRGFSANAISIKEVGKFKGST
jgi:hypothetical protein